VLILKKTFIFSCLFKEDFLRVHQKKPFSEYKVEQSRPSSLKNYVKMKLIFSSAPKQFIGVLSLPEKIS
jgi:hypothetical protein